MPRVAQLAAQGAFHQPQSFASSKGCQDFDEIEIMYYVWYTITAL